MRSQKHRRNEGLTSLSWTTKIELSSGLFCFANDLSKFEPLEKERVFSFVTLK